MLLTFHAVYFEGDDPRNIIGMVPELSGAITQGSDLDDARASLRSVVRLMLHTLTEWPRVREVVGDHRVLSREPITVDDEEPNTYCADLPLFPDPEPDEIDAYLELMTPTAFDIEVMFPHDTRGGDLPTFHLPDHLRFIDDMRAAGMQVHLYDGEGGDGDRPYYGPAVTTRDRIALQDAIRATRVRVLWHHLGEIGAMVYPAVNDLVLRAERVPLTSADQSGRLDDKRDEGRSEN
ncbi:MAG: hypothetical protein AABO58_00935 [Acidobacteriota bacterium]